MHLASTFMFSLLARASGAVQAGFQYVTRATPMITAPIEPATAYDNNFVFPFKTLKSDRLVLAPFVPEIHSEANYQVTSPYPHLYQFLGFGPFKSAEHFNTSWFEPEIQQKNDRLLLTIFDITYDPPAVAGTIGIQRASPEKNSAEMAYFCVPGRGFGGTHVASHSLGLLMQYFFEPKEKGGLGLDRVAYTADANNWSSIGACKYFGMKEEGRQTSPTGVKEVVMATYKSDWERDNRARIAHIMATR